MKGFIWVFLLSIIWGPSFVFSKIAGNDFSGITLVALRMFFAAAFLLTWCKLYQIKLPRNLTLWKHSAIMGFLACSFPLVSLTFILSHIPTIWFSLITGLVPIMVCLLSAKFLKDEIISKYNILGVFLGFLGMIVLFIPMLTDDDYRYDALILFLCFLITFSFASSIVYSKKYLSNLEGLTSSTMQICTSTIYLLPLSFIIDFPWQFNFISINSSLSILYLSIFSTAIAFIIYFYIINKYGPICLSMTNYLLPMTGTFSGVIFFGESITTSFFSAMILVLSGIFFTTTKEEKLAT